jgi:hypothetical protein
MDGEGTYTLRPSRTMNLRFQPLLILGMTDEETIKFVARIFGVTYDRLRSRRLWRKDMFRLRVTTEKEIRQIAEALIHFSRTRLKQLRLLLEFFSLKERLPGDKTDPEYEQVLFKMIDVYINLAILNHRGKPKDFEEKREKLRTKVRAR